MSTHVPARPDILALRLLPRQQITHTSTEDLYSLSRLGMKELKPPQMAVPVRWCRVTPLGCGSGALAEQCVLAVTACLSLFVTFLGAAGSYFLLTVWPWPALQLQLCMPKTKALTKAALPASTQVFFFFRWKLLQIVHYVSLSTSRSERFNHSLLIYKMSNSIFKKKKNIMVFQNPV